MDPKEKDIDLENKKALKKVLFYCLLYIFFELFTNILSYQNVVF